MPESTRRVFLSCLVILLVICLCLSLLAGGMMVFSLFQAAA